MSAMYSEESEKGIIQRLSIIPNILVSDRLHSVHGEFCQIIIVGYTLFGSTGYELVAAN